MAAHIPKQQLCERFVASHRHLARCPFRDRDEGLVRPALGADARDAKLRRVPEQVVAALARDLDACIGDACQCVAAREHGLGSKLQSERVDGRGGVTECEPETLSPSLGSRSRA